VAFRASPLIFPVFARTFRISPLSCWRLRSKRLRAGCTSVAWPPLSR